MKKYIFTILLMVAATGISQQGQSQTPDYLGLPGDNLNLFAVMKLFQESQTLEIFERNLNNEDMHINNLDLDQDGRIDYIRVIDNVDGDYHTIVLQDALSPRDIQDVAVFTVHRDRRGRVYIQLTGDEALYGRDYIVEPNYADLDYNETPNPGYTVNGETVVVNRTTTVEIATWPLIQFMFMPTYVVWHSPWYYNYYPSYWHPWRPYYWHYYYGYHYNWDPYYYGHYRVYNYHRDPYWHDTYYSHRRSYSPVVSNHVQSGSYRNTYSHPEARRAGYDMYYQKHPDQISRRSSRTIEDPVVRNSTQQRSTTTNGRRTLGESRSRNQGTQTVQPDTRGRSTQTVQPNTRGRSTQTVQPNTRSRSTDSRVSTTDQKRETQGNRSQTQTQTRTQTQTQTRTQTQTQQRPETRTQTQTRTQSQPRSSDQSGNRGGQQRQTETRTSGGRRTSDANTSGASRKPAEQKGSGSAKPSESRGGERR